MFICSLFCLAIASLVQNSFSALQEVEDTNGHEDQSVYVRQPRGLSPTEIANAAVSQLLKGARYIREQQGRSLYLKVGNYKDALRDFKSVKPANVKGHASKGGRSKTLTGTTGDRKLRVQTYDDSRLTKSRSDGMILVSSPREGELPYKIVYTQKKL